MVKAMETASTDDIDNWQSIGSIARRLARRLVEQRLAAARQGPAHTPAANDNALLGLRTSARTEKPRFRASSTTSRPILPVAPTTTTR